MKFNTSHNAWHGDYSTFMAWKKEIFELAGFPPLELMEGFYDPLPPNHTILPTLSAELLSEYPYSLKELDRKLPIKWSSLKPSPLHILVCQSNPHGYISWEACSAIADELEKLVFAMQELEHLYIVGQIEDWGDATKKFIDGLRLAGNKKEKLKFS